MWRRLDRIQYTSEKAPAPVTDGIDTGKRTPMDTGACSLVNSHYDEQE
jgi:hypothetical protein